MYWKNPVRSWRRQPNRYEYLNQTGKLISWTEISAPPVSFQWQQTYLVGLIKLDSGETTVHQLVEVSRDQLKMGMKLKGVLRKLYEDGPEGVITYGVKFKPIKQI